MVGGRAHSSAPVGRVPFLCWGTPSSSPGSVPRRENSASELMGLVHLIWDQGAFAQAAGMKGDMPPCNSNRNRNCISHRNCDITELWHFIFLGPCCQRDAGCPNQINVCFVAGRQDQKCPLGQSGAALPWLERVSRNLPAMLKGDVARSRMYLPWLFSYSFSHLGCLPHLSECHSTDKASNLKPLPAMFIWILDWPQLSGKTHLCTAFICDTSHSFQRQDAMTQNYLGGKIKQNRLYPLSYIHKQNYLFGGSFFFNNLLLCQVNLGLCGW